MKKDETGLTKLKDLITLQEAKIDLALETIQAIATLGAGCSLNSDSMPLEDLVPILSEFTERWNELCLEQV